MLTNVSYRRSKPEDVEKTNFVIDVFLCLTQNLKPAGLDRKLKIPLKRDYVKMIWDSCVPNHLLKSALRDHLQTIQYVYFLLFPKFYNRTNRFGINNKSHFDFISINWRHHKSNLVLPTPTKNKVVEQPVKKIILEIDITQQKQQKQEQQNEQEKEEILCARKRAESYEKSVAYPFEQKPEKNNQVLAPPTTPSPKLYGNTYSFEQKSEKK